MSVYRDEYCRYYDVHSVENLFTVYRNEYCRYYDIHSVENLFTVYLFSIEGMHIFDLMVTTSELRFTY